MAPGTIFGYKVLILSSSIIRSEFVGHRHPSLDYCPRLFSVHIPGDLAYPYPQLSMAVNMRSMGTLIIRYHIDEPCATGIDDGRERDYNFIEDMDV
jgi:hypothetical protein